MEKNIMDEITYNIGYFKILDQGIRCTISEVADYIYKQLEGFELGDRLVFTGDEKMLKSLFNQYQKICTRKF